MTENSSFAHSHNQLGSIIGLTRDDDIVQFRGLPYATIPGRFRQSIVTTELPTQPFKAINPGPKCPQAEVPYPYLWPESASSQGLSLPPAAVDEFGCLNLNVTVPRVALDHSNSGSLPVLVFIHGGAFSTGCSTEQVSGREVFDAANLVRTSLRRGKPFIVVTINYRVGALGFLASKQLSDFNEKHGEPSYNYGLHDQRQAVEWVSKFIRGFGGDPENITIHGTSAGAASCHYQVLFPNRKFKRAILSSGTAMALGPFEIEKLQPTFNGILATLDTTRDNIQDVELLQALTTGKFIKIAQGPTMAPVIDHVWHDLAEFMYGAWPNSPFPVSSAVTLAQSARFWHASALIKNPASFPDSCPTVVSAYGLENALADPTNAFEDWCNGRILLYNFQASNPFPAAYCYGRSNHGVNDLMLFDPAIDQVPEKHLEDWKGAVHQFQRAVIEFYHGELPWEPIRPRCDKLESCGPLVSFVNGDKWKLSDTLLQAVGQKVTGRWSTVLQSMQS